MWSKKTQTTEAKTLLKHILFSSLLLFRNSKLELIIRVQDILYHYDLIKSIRFMDLWSVRNSN